MRTGRPEAYEVTKEQLYDMYHVQKMVIADMSQVLNMPRNSLRNYMVRMDIPLRTAKEAHALAIKQGRMQGVQLLLTKEELEDLYITKQHSIGMIAKQIGCTTGGVQRALIKWNIPRRSTGEGSRLAYLLGRRVKRGHYLSGGYVYISKPEHHRANKQGWVLEHIVIWEERNSRILPDGWVIHHINGLRADNRHVNLFAMPLKNHHYALYLQAMQKRIRTLERELKQANIQTRVGY